MNIKSISHSLRRSCVVGYRIALAAVILQVSPAFGTELQYDQGASDKAQTVRGLEMQTRICMKSSIRGSLRQGQRDSEKIIDFAVWSCGSGLQRLLMSGFASDPETAESSMTYLRSLATAELSKIPGITNSEPSQTTKADDAVIAYDAPRTKTDMASELAEAPRIAISTIRKSGLSGLTERINDCYKPAGKGNEQLFKCIYLDIAARYIDQIAVEALHTSPSPFFQDSKFGARIGPVLRRSNMDTEDANRYLKTVSAAIRKITDDELDANPL